MQEALVTMDINAPKPTKRRHPEHFGGPKGAEHHLDKKQPGGCREKTLRDVDATSESSNHPELTTDELV